MVSDGESEKVDLEAWFANLPDEFDDEFMGNLTGYDCERIEDNRDRLTPKQDAAYRAYMKAHIGDLFTGADLSPGMKQLSESLIRLSRVQGDARKKLEKFTAPAHMDFPRPMVPQVDTESLAKSLEEAAEAKRRERDEQVQRELDTLGALRGIHATLTEQNARSAHGEWVAHATLGLALVGVVAAIGALAWAVSEDRSTTAWVSLAALLVGAGVILALPRIRSRRP